MPLTATHISIAKAAGSSLGMTSECISAGSGGARRGSARTRICTGGSSTERSAGPAGALSSQPYCYVSLSTSCSSRRPQGFADNEDRAADIGQDGCAIAWAWWWAEYRRTKREPKGLRRCHVQRTQVGDNMQ
jgi:hypothetical protein